MEELVIVVNTEDQEIGLLEKLQAHKTATLHRAFSIFIFNSEGKMLLHQRAKTKYHSGGLWTNACCSHPRKGETILASAHRRLIEEMGFDCPLQEIFSFIYKAPLDAGLWEHEYDHVLIGTYDGTCEHINPNEVDAIRWISIEDLQKEIQNRPEHFTIWFQIAVNQVIDFLQIHKK